MAVVVFNSAGHGFAELLQLPIPNEMPAGGFIDFRKFVVKIRNGVAGNDAAGTLSYLPIKGLQIESDILGQVQRICADFPGAVFLDNVEGGFERIGPADME